MIHGRRSALLALSASLLLVACGSRRRNPATNHYAPKQAVDPMVGADAGELIAANGPPTEVMTLPSGNRAYVYAQRRSGHQHPDGRTCVDSYIVDHEDIVVDFICR